MNAENFRREAHRMVDWMADYLQDVEKYPVRAQVSPREIFEQLPDEAPVQGEEMSAIFQDFEKIILPGITHWQSPNFYAYFPANASPPSLLAEMLTATLGAQCMIWETSPAAAELEEKVTGWLGKLIGIPAEWAGVIQSTASESTLCALLSARERASQFSINESGFSGKEKYRVYGSSQTHSSIEKGLKIAGLGSNSFVKVPVDESFAMNPDLLRLLISSDLKEGHTPLAVVASLGTTGSTAMDSLEEIGKICREHGIWLHVDAAYAGSAFILPEYQH
ncbi:MAG: aspartate aminotransferase family protein, partial [Bacteroidetes bacterium]